MIFKVEKLYASWVNENIRLVLSKKELDFNQCNEIQIEREILLLSFKNGILLTSSKEIERYISKSLKDYTKELNV